MCISFLLQSTHGGLKRSLQLIRRRLLEQTVELLLVHAQHLLPLGLRRRDDVGDALVDCSLRARRLARVFVDHADVVQQPDLARAHLRHQHDASQHTPPEDRALVVVGRRQFVERDLLVGHAVGQLHLRRRGRRLRLRLGRRLRLRRLRLRRLGLLVRLAGRGGLAALFARRVRRDLVLRQHVLALLTRRLGRRLARDLRRVEILRRVQQHRNGALRVLLARARAELVLAVVLLEALEHRRGLEQVLALDELSGHAGRQLLADHRVGRGRDVADLRNHLAPQDIVDADHALLLAVDRDDDVVLVLFCHGAVGEGAAGVARARGRGRSTGFFA